MSEQFYTNIIPYKGNLCICIHTHTYILYTYQIFHVEKKVDLHEADREKRDRNKRNVSFGGFIIKHSY